MNWKTDLPSKILVRVNEDNMGSLIVTPVSEKIQKLVSQSNEYNAAHDLYLQDSQDIQSFLESYPKARYRTNKNDGETWGGYKIGRLWYFVNDNVRFYIDSWDYRHMVGGQSD